MCAWFSWMETLSLVSYVATISQSAYVVDQLFGLASPNLPQLMISGWSTVRLLWRRILLLKTTVSACPSWFTGLICVGLGLTANWSAGLGTQSARAFPVATACLWNSHPSDISRPPLSIFCCRLKSSVFSLSYPAFWLFSHLPTQWLWLLILDSIIITFNILMFSSVHSVQAYKCNDCLLLRM